MTNKNAKTSRAAEFFSLDAEKALLKKIGDPHMDLRYVHVAGTNGKGSVCAYIESILLKNGLRVGCFTSPFFHAPNELIRVDGETVSQEEFDRIYADLKIVCDELLSQGISVSEYELYTVMAFVIFKNHDCDIVVMEVNMGGSVDSTNVIPTPLVSVISPISYDHMGMLGDTLSEIAMEKAGIIKPGTVVVSASQEPEVSAVLEAVCEEKGVDLFYANSTDVSERSLQGQRFHISDAAGADEGEYETQLLGTYQPDNAALSLLAADKLKERGYEISEEAKREGIKDTRWFGRFTMISEDPPIVVDGGHNIQGAMVLKDSLDKYFPGKKISFILGILADKEVDKMLDILLPIAKEVFCIAVPNDRTMDPEVLAEKVRKKDVSAKVIQDLNEYKDIVSDCEVLCIAGSLYLIGRLA